MASKLSPSPETLLSKFPQPHAVFLLRSSFLCRSADSHPPSILRIVPDWADGIKEKGMKQKRSLYDHAKWIEHRSSARHLRHVLNSLSSRVILSLVPPVIACTCVAVLVAGYNSAVWMRWLPEFFPVLRASSLAYQLAAPALALLLVFRTEASYSRFEEGKKAWTKVVAASNDLVTQVIGSAENCVDEKVVSDIVKYVVAFPLALKCHIIHGSDIANDLEHILESDDLSIVVRSNHRPRCVIEFISRSLKLLDLEATKLNMLESKLWCFHEGIEVCEQLIGIPIPLSYTRLTSRLLVLWHLTLPVILWDDCCWIVVPATLISAAALFGIEEVGVLIEEPFPMLALDQVCEKVCRNADEALQNGRVIRDHVNCRRTRYRTAKTSSSHNGWPKTSVEDHQPDREDWCAKCACFRIEMSIFDAIFADTELSKRTPIFGLRLWMVIGIAVGAAVVIVLFLFSLCITASRRHNVRKRKILQPVKVSSGSDVTPVVSKDILEIGFQSTAGDQRPMLHQV
ncbi:hypothetical protein M569_13821 [Genlisea aurea]|uniref:Uncharacterized protein n=1 Tax=Genlisea aurea TaxID=192259 RepID=S8C2U9_9LAMI|nr:hypothetical protein M569_13821 [Genlisea aurea]